MLDGELIGDPLEVQIFRSTGASIVGTPPSSSPSSSSASTSATTIRLPSSPHPRIVHLLHGYEFQSALQRMTVLCRDDAGQHFVFTKGAPEVIQSLCHPSTVPADFTATFAGYARHGYRILAIAYRPIDPSALSEDRDAVRPRLESELRLLGLIVLENAVKEETAPTLAVLQRAKVRCVMVTGDYPVTAVSVAKECGLVPAGVRVYQGRMRDGTVEWADSDDETQRLDAETLRPLSAAPHPYELAVTGDVFRHLAQGKGEVEAFHRVLLCTAVFARMTPDQKAALVISLQHLGLYTGMCGDGSNDAPALRSSHAGISLSTTEASIAAPFTYLEPNIRCVPMLLSQGRSALQTSFSLFKFIAMYDTPTQTHTSTLLPHFPPVATCVSSHGPLPAAVCRYSLIQFGRRHPVLLRRLRAGQLAVFVPGHVRGLRADPPHGRHRGRARAVRQAAQRRPPLPHQLPLRLSPTWPSASHSKSPSSLAVRTQPGYVDYQDALGFDNGPETMETTSLYYFSNFQYLLYAVLFARGHPWKRPVYTNLRFTAWCLVVLAANLALLFSEPVVGFWRGDDVSLPGGWRGGILGFVVAQVVCSCVWELSMLPRINRWWKGRRRRRGGGEVGEVYGHVKRISGSGVKEYHRLRGEFERGWKGARAAMEDGGHR